MAIRVLTVADLTVEVVEQCYALVAETSWPAPEGLFESAHFVHDPTVVLAYQGERLVGLQVHKLYRLPTPFWRREAPVIFAGLGFVSPIVAGRRVAHRMAIRYLRHALGPWWPLRRHVIITATCTPRLMQLFDAQYRLYLPFDGPVAPSVVDFVRSFSRDHRHIPWPVDDELVRRAPGLPAGDVTDQWPRLYHATQQRFNDLVFRLGLMYSEGGRVFINLDSHLLVVGHTTPAKMLKGAWAALRSSTSASRV